MLRKIKLDHSTHFVCSGTLIRLVSLSNHAQDDTHKQGEPNAYRKPLRTQQESRPNA